MINGREASGHHRAGAISQFDRAKSRNDRVHKSVEIGRTVNQRGVAAGSACESEST